MFAFAGAVLLFIQFKNDKQPYVTSWVIGSILIGIATVLVAMKEALPVFFSYDLGNCINIASYIYFYYSCVGLLGKKLHFSWLALIALVAGIIFMATLGLVRHYLGPEWQPAVVALGGVAFNFYTALPVINFYKKTQIRLSLALGVILFLNAFVWFVRLLTICFYGIGFAFEGGAINALTFTFLMILGILRYMYFAGLVTSIEWNKKEELITENHLMKLELANKKVEQTELQFLASLNALAKARDDETGNHIIRTQRYVRVLALRLRNEGHHTQSLTDQSIELLVKAAPLHDLGKIGIPDGILLKKGKLNEDEWAIMKTHTLIGESVLDALKIERDGESDVIAKAIAIAGGHHEKWDGTGYPRGLVGEDIPLGARIMSLADMYDALVSERVYKKSWTHAQAVQEIISKSGTQFDPKLVDAFVIEQETFQEISQKYRDS